MKIFLEQPQHPEGRTSSKDLRGNVEIERIECKEGNGKLNK